MSPCLVRGLSGNDKNDEGHVDLGFPPLYLSGPPRSNLSLGTEKDSVLRRLKLTTASFITLPMEEATGA